ncbi:hypothetical protein [Streptomyces sp. TLI_105]|uniref:hypothetical protein n=1 Tax=Streptomyces sp. TLI_105 TaxID=1881019 RepID=UPI00089D06FE|nr:hypothetical protein [Streptomyces sp. TLI_105]SED23614.1 hypothetical protein SAMN05428939_4612 [Streptomyces sp. TLI_105]
MKTERRGGTALGAKVLGAVLLIPAVALAACSVVADHCQEARERDAFEATREDAARFADALVAEKGLTPTDQDVRDALDHFAGHGPHLGAPAVVRPVEGGTRVFVPFSRRYERTVPVFGPADAVATRCFTIDLPKAGPARPRVTAHDSGEPCHG